ncbi:DUF2442 domain-containing protein [candidate division KSB1 bacterium]|nr:DUF2442 domain-containing protein [candidate division KSB1 bacterium]
MVHAIYRVTSFEILAPFMLQVGFDDKTTQKINFKPILKGTIYGPLNDLALFNQVQIDPEVHTLVWPNGADFDPATLHDWQDQFEEFKQLSHNWVNTSNKTCL